MLRCLLLGLALIGGCATAPRDFAALVREQGAAVVKIGAYAPSIAGESVEEEELPPGDVPDAFERLLGGNGVPQGPSLGSGFLISADGYIVTNAHLVEDALADSVMVRLADRRDFRAKLVGADALSDIALLKIDAAGLPHVRFGDARALQPGQWVAAIGAPLGLEQSVTAGIISAVGRVLPEESYLPFIQTDVAINPGNSGGPLFNTRGEVVGVNSVMYSGSGGSMGLSFAVPIDLAMHVVVELKARGQVTRGRIGVRLQELTLELARALRVPGNSGALVVDVLREGPAQRAGLRPADVIVEFGGKAVGSHVELMRLVDRTRPGGTVDARYVRDARMLSTRVTVEAAKATARSATATLADPVGLRVAPVTPARLKRLGLESGVLVLQAESAAQRAGLEPGDIILSVNGAPVATPYGFNERLRAAGQGTSLALLIQRDGARSFVALRLPD